MHGRVGVLRYRTRAPRVPGGSRLVKCRGRCRDSRWRAALGVVVKFTTDLSRDGYVKCNNCNITFPAMYAVSSPRTACPCCLSACKIRAGSFGRNATKSVYRHE